HSYRYDSYDAKYETLKYTHPKECSACPCPLAQEGLCQKVFKMKITKDIRRYTAPARGSVAWKKIFNKRTAVERVNGYLKEFFQLDNVRYRTGKRAKAHCDMRSEEHTSELQSRFDLVCRLLRAKKKNTSDGLRSRLYPVSVDLATSLLSYNDKYQNKHILCI